MKYIFMIITIILFLLANTNLFVQRAIAATHQSVAVPTLTSTVTLNIQHIALTDAIRLLANFLHINVIISSTITGETTLHLQKANPTDAFNLLLTSSGLAKWPVGNIWYIAPRLELIKRQQEESKWQQAQNDAAPLLTQVIPIIYGNARDIARLLQDERTSFLSTRGRVRVDVRTNALCIQEIAERLARVRALIKKLDVPVKQVLIEARLASVDSDFERELGVRFAAETTATVDATLNSGGAAATSAMGQYSLAVAKLADGSLLDVKLAALESEGHAELISSPSLFTANQRAASIEAGEEVPYQEVSDSGGTAVVFKKAVLGLKVLPHVLPGNKVLLQLQINQDRPSHRMVLGMPTISTRQITTSVLVKAGQTIVLGGIYESNQENGQQRLPFISQVPLLGALLMQRNTRKSKRELLIFVTPKIIATDTDTS